MLRRLCLSSIIVCSLVGATWAQGSDEASDYSLPAASLTQSVTAISQHSGLQVVYESAPPKDLKAGPITGHLTARQALDKALAGSGLTYEFINNGTVVIRKAPARAADDKQQPAAKNKQGSNSKTDDGEEPKELASIIVTGTRIHGAPPTSPVIDITQDQIIQAGQTDLGEVIRSIPQNFSGGQNPGVNVGPSLSNVGNQNMSGGSALNLRGLGADATLTLLNGHRLSYDGFSQAVDISMIPLAALDRLEIVADGASAIYGSDAVGGVANVILKPDFDGITTTARMGKATSGGDFEQDYGMVAGNTWSSGGFIMTLDSEDNTNIKTSQRSYTSDQASPYSLYPAMYKQTALFSLHQDVVDWATFSVDALYNQRKERFAYSTGSSTYSITGYNASYTLSPTLTFKLPADWTLAINGLHGRDRTVSDQYGYGSYSFHSADCYCNGIQGYEVDAEGGLFSLPGGEVRAAFGGGYRKNSYNEYSLTSTYEMYGAQHSYYGYGEVYLPLVSPDTGIPGVQRLSLTAAARHENYNDFGSVTTPKVGLLYAPTQDFDVKGTWGKSFKAPTLLQQYEGAYAYLWPAAEMGATGYPSTATALMAYGGNPDLKPERATSWTTSLALHPQMLPAFTAELSYFHVDYRDRIIQPLTNYFNSFSDPAYAEFVDYDPTTAKQDKVLNNATFYNEAGAAYDPSNVIAILNDQYTNVARQKIHGIDLSAQYHIDLGNSSLDLSAKATWLDSEQQNSSKAAAFDLAGTVYNPPNFRSRLGVSWLRGPLMLSAYYNYIGGVTNTYVTPNIEGEGWQTVDLTAIYRFPTDTGLLHALDLSFSIQNLANQAPPSLKTQYSYFINFDSTNYSPIGRYVSLSVSKHW